MGPFPSSSIAVLLLATFPANAAGASFFTPAECARFLAEDPVRGILEAHSRLAAKPIRGMDPAELASAVAEAVAFKKSVTGSFPDAEFREFADPAAIADARHSLPETARLDALLDALHGKFLPVFERKRIEAQAALQDGLAAAAEIPRRAMDECKGWSCFQARIRTMATGVAKKLGGTCMAANPVTISNFARDLAFSWSGMIIAFSHRKDVKLKDFPFEYVATGLVMGSIVSESSCRKYFVKPESPGKATRPASAGARVWNYMRWYPATATVALMFSIIADQARGKEFQGGEKYFLRWVYYMLFEAVTSPLRKVFLQEPIIYALLPRLQEVLKGWVKSGVLRNVVAEGANWGTRVGLNTLKAEMRFGGDYGFKKFMEWIETRKAPPPIAADAYRDSPGPVLTEAEIEAIARQMDADEVDDPLFRPPGSENEPAGG